MKKDNPRRVENFLVDGRCESCGKDLRKWVWVWREHTACSKVCVQACETYEQKTDMYAINADASDYNGNKPIGTRGIFGHDT